MSPPFTDSTIHSARRRVGLALALAALAGTLTLGLVTAHAQGPSPKNVVLILTDDQTASELTAMPNVQSLLASRGTTFRHAYASYPLCCPSRSTLLSGQYMHNHGVHGNIPPFGGWENFKRHESNTLPVWMHDQGFYNVHIGKYMNGYGPTAADPLPVPDGWDEWYGKIATDDLYFNYLMVEQTGPNDPPELKFYGGQPSDYQTDSFGAKAAEFIDEVSGAQTPFMMNVWFNAPHGPFEPAPRHLFTQSNAALPKLPGFDEKNIRDKPKWLRKQARKRLNKGLKRTIANERRRRLEQLLSVDEAVRRIVLALDAQGILDDTYIIFSSDNGFFRGEHRIAGGKYLPYDPSSKVPLVIRGPGIPPGGISDELVWLGDVPQTILDVNGPTDPAIDGRSLLPYAQNPVARSSRPLLLEGDTGPGQAPPGFDPASAAGVAQTATAKAHLARKRGVKNLDQEPNPIKSLKAAANGNFAPAYKAIRTDRYLYVLYANGQTELYDMRFDPAQLRSLAHDRRFRPVRRYLLGQLIALSLCNGAACRADIPLEPAPRKLKRKPKKKGQQETKQGR